MDDHSVRSKKVGRISELTLAVPIQEGRIPGELRTFRERLVDGLGDFQRRIEAGIPTPAGRVGTIHFARWWIYDPPAGPSLLFFTSNFDGNLESYLHRFATRIPDAIDDVWKNCVGYPEGGCRDFAAFLRYVKAHQSNVLTFVVARPDLTLEDIRLLEGARHGAR